MQLGYEPAEDDTRQARRKGRPDNKVLYTADMGLGMALIVLDGILDVATFGMAPAAMLAPLASLVLVHNVILHRVC